MTWRRPQRARRTDAPVPDGFVAAVMVSIAVLLLTGALGGSG